MIRNAILDYSLWIYGLMVSMIGGSFIFLETKKVDKETCKTTHIATQKQLESMDRKLDKLIDLHLNGNKNNN